MVVHHQKQQNQNQEEEKSYNDKEITQWKSWKNTIRTTLRNQNDRKGELKSIRKIVLKLYKKLNKDDEEKSKNIFLEKIKKDKRIEINDDETILKLID